MPSGLITNLYLTSSTYRGGKARPSSRKPSEGKLIRKESPILVKLIMKSSAFFPEREGRREGQERDGFIDTLMYAFIGCLLPTTLASQDDALTNSTTHPVPSTFRLLIHFNGYI